MVSFIWRPPTFVGNQGIGLSNGLRGTVAGYLFALSPSGYLSAFLLALSRPTSGRYLSAGGEDLRCRVRWAAGRNAPEISATPSFIGGALRGLRPLTHPTPPLSLQAVTAREISATPSCIGGALRGLRPRLERAGGGLGFAIPTLTFWGERRSRRKRSGSGLQAPTRNRVRPQAVTHRARASPPSCIGGALRGLTPLTHPTPPSSPQA